MITQKIIKVLFLLVIPLFLYIALLPVMPLMEPDEARYSDIPSLMNRSGDYVTPRLDHVTYLEKPPLCYWVTALFYKMFGENEFSSRLFAALCAWGCILLVYAMGTFFHDEKTGLYSAGVLSTFLYHSVLGRMNVLDIPLTFFVCLATWAGYRHLVGKEPRKGWIYLLYLASALAFLTKGLIGIVLPFAILILWLFIVKRGRDSLRFFSPLGIILFLTVSFPWVFFVQKANEDFLWFFFIREHFLRYTTTLHGRNHLFLLYIPVVLLGTLPWSAFFVKAVRERRRKGVPLFKTDDKRFLLVWGLFIFIFFSISSSKLVTYIAPVFLPLAVFLGHLFRVYEDESIVPGNGLGGKLLSHLPVVLQSLLFITLLLLPPFLKNMKLGSDLISVPSQKWWLLIFLPILLQATILFLPDWVKRRWKRGWFMTTYLLSALFLGSLLFPIAEFLTPYKTTYPITQAVKTFLPANQTLYQYDVSLYGIDFYRKIRTPMVQYSGELRFGIKQLSLEERSYYFPSVEDFYKLCKEKNESYCVTKDKRRLELLKKRVPNTEVLWENGIFYLLRLHGN